MVMFQQQTKKVEIMLLLLLLGKRRRQRSVPNYLCKRSPRVVPIGLGNVRC